MEARMEKRSKEALVLIILPVGMSAFVAIKAVQNAFDGGSLGWIVAAAGGLVGIALVLMLLRLSTTGTGGASTPLRRWFTPLLIISIGLVSFSPQIGQTAQAGILMLGSAFLATFATVALIRFRRAG
jgi:hypothetical protein